MSKQAPPAVVDISNSNWKFAYRGQAVRHALFEKAGLLEQEYAEILNHVKEGFEETSIEGVIAAFVQTFTKKCNWRSSMLITLCERAAHIHTEILECRRAANGFSDEIIYRMALEDLERLGLGLIAARVEEGP
jgi:predicted GNAT superfamily acetyltransferase